MSTEGTQPPSIAPKRPTGSGSPGVRTADGTQPRPASEPVSGSTPPSASSGTSTGPSVGTRIKKAASNAAGAARNALPTRDDVELEEQPPRRVSASSAGQPSPGAASASGPAPSSGPRKVRLAIARVDPWSVMKLSFLLSVAVGIMIVIAAAVVWYTLDEMAVFTQVNEVIATLAGSPEFFDLEEYAAFDRVVSLATMVAVVDIVLLTALATIGAFLYNIVAALVGGIHLTLTDD